MLGLSLLIVKDLLTEIMFITIKFLHFNLVPTLKSFFLMIKIMIIPNQRKHFLLMLLTSVFIALMI